jgi:hypothetical protein
MVSLTKKYKTSYFVNSVQTAIAKNVNSKKGITRHKGATMMR